MKRMALGLTLHMFLGWFCPVSMAMAAEASAEALPAMCFVEDTAQSDSTSLAAPCMEQHPAPAHCLSSSQNEESSLPSVTSAVAPITGCIPHGEPSNHASVTTEGGGDTNDNSIATVILRE